VVDHTLSGNISPEAAFAAGEAAARAHATAAPQAAASGAAAGQAANEVTIDNFAFTPKIVSVRVGSKLTWRNRDDVPHKIQSTDKSFRGLAPPGYESTIHGGVPREAESFRISAPCTR